MEPEGIIRRAKEYKMGKKIMKRLINFSSASDDFLKRKNIEKV
jgi:hypothetical protein